jgi:6-phosphogluconolactonase
MASHPLVVVHRDKALLAEASAARLTLAILDAQAARGEAGIVLTGGSMGSTILEALGRSALREAVDWAAVSIWWGDERFVPAGDEDRNETQARAALLEKLPLDPARVHPMAASDQAGSPQEAAELYAGQLAAAAGEHGEVPTFDVVMLGVGPDAHIASLFPGHPALSATGSTVGVHDSPKPPPERVSLTFEALERGAEVWFLVAGQDKADAVRRSLGGASREEAPAGSVRGATRTLWLLDAEAASLLPTS